MRYAAISDIHGNLPALLAVLRDAEEQRIDKFLLVGDYYHDMPFPNEVTDIIKKLPNAYLVRGNKEDYLIELGEKDPSEFKYDQFAPLYWNYRTLSKDNIVYLTGLPKEAIIHDDSGKIIRMAHASGHFFDSESKQLGSSNYATKMYEKPFGHSEYLQFVSSVLSGDSRFMESMDLLQDGIYVFGHSHVQWHIRFGGKLLVNAGSCGVALDFNTTAAYTIIDSNGDNPSIEERRVYYDIESAVAQMKASDLYSSAKTWSDIMIEHLRTGTEKIAFFMRHLERIAVEQNDTDRPFSNETWNLAVRKWFE